VSKWLAGIIRADILLAMKTICLGGSSLRASRLAFGCWRLAAGMRDGQADAASVIEAGKKAVIAAYEAGYTLFDHADIYCDGWSEKVFGEALREVSGMRERVVIASKCGIRKTNEPQMGAPYRYDFSREHIIWSCEQSLKRLGVETIDLYQLHRPDYLCEPAEVAAAFEELRRSGKAREFGVSNFRPSQVSMLQKHCPMKLLVNQVEISLAYLAPFEDGTLDQCIELGMTPLAWSPLAGGLLADGARRLLPSQQSYQTGPIVTALDQMAAARGVSRSVLALAWLMRHPSGIVPIVGSTKPERIREAARADTVELSREEWYQLLTAARSQRLA